MPRDPVGIHIVGAGMKLVLSSVALALLAISANAETLSVATYNIKHGQGMDDSVDLARQAKVLAALDVDVIALQEVDMLNRRTGFADQTAQMARHLSAETGHDWRHLDAPAIAFEGGHYGNGLLFNAGALELVDFQNIALPESDQGDGARSAAVAHLRTPAGKDVTVIGTHLTHKNAATTGDSTYQLDSVQLIDTAAGTGHPAILAGDLNASVDPALNHNPDTIARLVDLGWRIDSPTTGRTVPDEGFETVIDFILTKGAGSWTVSDARIVDDETTALASDHFPVVVTWELAP
ncbi:MAG: endonuclease/exonuclease/phosphatase family protein [Paracoccus sp. (in: a-proteobacteria)]|uniref:endonuclease/exonuclease/phosphatase family protein n=1 Tax=Paracoccus sp. TaxID=267 RepID=UPI0026E0234E|nr:endonuclease/exonuclease/phosphatase family protein [Paracoccus sp. (in: a-proteobacteria)]MDO5614414.1 endonuclease/exonuclease/phosphatase family protein [Paracoccus sp. (in: a-proteobacteria)]